MTVDPSCCFHVLAFLRPLLWSAGSRTFSSVDTTNGFGIGTSDDLRSRMKWCFVMIFGRSGNACLVSSLALEPIV